MEQLTDSLCRNCGAATSGNFCHMCGQETRLHAPSFGEFMHEFVGHYVALEGRLWGTITRLLFRPGLLTNEYLAGRRKRYVEPLRLYLSLSIIFFALLKLTSPSIAEFDAQPVPAVLSQEAQRVKQEVEQEVVQAERAKRPEFFNARLEQALAEKYPGVHRSVTHFRDMTPEEKGKVLTTAFYKFGPYALFLVMPLFALYLKLLYLGSGKRYGEHLLFALHANAFAFFMFGLFMYAPEGFIKLLLFLWVLGYLPWAMQRVYRKGRWGTAWRWLLLVTLHVLSLLWAMAVVMAFGVLSVH